LVTIHFVSSRLTPNSSYRYTCRHYLPEANQAEKFWSRFTHSRPWRRENVLPPGRQLNLPRLPFPVTHSQRGGHSSNADVVRKYYSTLLKSDVRQLYEMYRLDHQVPTL